MICSMLLEFVMLVFALLVLELLDATATGSDGLIAGDNSPDFRPLPDALNVTTLDSGLG